VAWEPDTGIGGAAHRFPTTRQTLIEAAAGGGPAAREALSAIATVYWKPAYKHVRIAWRRSNEEAKDLVQGFFAALLEQDTLARFDPEKARLRTYLRACLDHFVQKQDESASRQKRGGGIEFAPFDFDAADREMAAASPSPEDVFFREWQREMFSLSLADLRDYCEASGKQVQHRIFTQYDLADGARPGYQELAEEHGIAVTTVTNYLAWARRELRRLAQARLNGITSGDRESRAELRFLFGNP
jgi:RNA polymerase sigma factor (sigma-70 family)